MLTSRTDFWGGGRGGGIGIKNYEVKIKNLVYWSLSTNLFLTPDILFVRASGSIPIDNH
jgi:hypothetical protein